jgi:hypothetical protein
LFLLEYILKKIIFFVFCVRMILIKMKKEKCFLVYIKCMKNVIKKSSNFANNSINALFVK